MSRTLPSGIIARLKGVCNLGPVQKSAKDNPADSSKSSLASRPGAALLTRAIILVGGLVLLSVFARAMDYFPGDPYVSRWIQTWQSPWLDSVMKWISLLGEPAPAAVTFIVFAGLILLTTGLKNAGFLATSALATFVLNLGLKFAVERPRPSFTMVRVVTEEGGHSFPSAHTMYLTVLLGLFIFFMSLYLKPGWVKRTVQIASIAFLLATGVSRIYLGAHWMSDVIGGYLFGLAILWLTIWLYRTKIFRQKHRHI